MADDKQSPSADGYIKSQYPSISGVPYGIGPGRRIATPGHPIRSLALT